MASPIGTGGNIGARQCSQRVHGCLSSLAATKVTAVDQEVSILREALADFLELFGVDRADRILCQEARAEVHFGFGAITDQVDRIDARATGERLRHLFDAVAGRVEHMHFDVGADAVEQLLVVADAGGQKQDLLAGGRCVVHRQGIEQRLVAGGELRFACWCYRRVVGCRRVISSKERVRLALRDLLSGHGTDRGHGGPVEHDARFERQQRPTERRQGWGRVHGSMTTPPRRLACRFLLPS